MQSIVLVLYYLNFFYKKLNEEIMPFKFSLHHIISPFAITFFVEQQWVMIMAS